MKFVSRAWILAAAAATLVAGGLFVREARAAGPVMEVVEINGHRMRFDSGVAAFVRYLLIDPANADPAVDGFAPIPTRAVLMLFTGGDGRLNLTPGQLNNGSPNFLVRTRHHFAAEGYVVAVVDAASDFLAHVHADTVDGQGFLHGTGLRGHRVPGRLHADKHLQDIAAVMDDLRVRYPHLPLWAVGTSRGTISAAVAAAVASPPPDGIVLTSPLTGPSAVGDLNGVNLASITIPVLIVANHDDQCFVTRPADARALRRRLWASRDVELRIFNGGSRPLSDPCDPLTGHGFFGIEQRVIEAITTWIRRVSR